MPLNLIYALDKSFFSMDQIISILILRAKLLITSSALMLAANESFSQPTNGTI